MDDRYARSRAMLERARQSLVGGVSSPFRAKANVPLFFEDATGARLRDVDGNEYIDYALAWGPLILGHKHPALVEAMQRQAGRPHNYGAQHALEAEVSERVQKMVPCADLVAYSSTGSEAVAGAWRLARAVTGRHRILRFEGHYHGWHDAELVSYRPAANAMGSADSPCATLDSRGQVANTLDNVVVVPWNDARALERAFERFGREIAAVMTEPVLCNSGCLMPEPEFLQALNRVPREHGALLIFDEVITGFRMAPGGAQEYFGITPDLATFGKALAGGITLSAFAGRKELMLEMLNGVAYGGTFNGNPIAMAAAVATLDVLAADDGAALKRANTLGKRLQDGIAAAARECGVPLRITGFGAAFSLHFTSREKLRCYRDTLDDDRDRLARFLRATLDHGLYLLPDGRIYVSAAHTEADIEETIAIAGQQMHDCFQD
ncbi:MAG: aspartate aminotransferase family protein [Candidatus Solibacter usitatus]|nr:aspartate aminotransferase family protein [Candidatus Solibacter usitatus]